MKTRRGAVSTRALVAAGVLVGAWALTLGTPPSTAADGAALTPEQTRWLEEEAPLIRKEEKKAFLALKESYRRDAFIQAWWRARDPDPATPENEFKRAWEARLAEVRERFGDAAKRDERARAFLLHGEPADVHETSCQLFLWPTEIWTYAGNPDLPNGLVLLFVQEGGGGPFRLWHPEDGFSSLQALFRGVDNPSVDTNEATFFGLLREKCHGDEGLVETAIHGVIQERSSGLAAVERPPVPRDTEWLASFAATSTDLPAAQAAGGAAPAAAGARPAKPAPRSVKPVVGEKDLSPDQRRWLEEEALLISKEERRQLFALAESYQRDGYIRDWWRARDPDPSTPRNEFKDAWEERVKLPGSATTT